MAHCLSNTVLFGNLLPPLLEGLETTLAGQQVTLGGTVVDALTSVASIQYMVNGEAPWLPALPKDLIFDSTREAFAVTIDLSGAGSHVITLKMADTRANVRFHQILLDVE